MVGCFALAAPKVLPPAIGQRLWQSLQDGGATPASGQEDIAKLVREDIARYASVVKFANVTP